MSYGHISVAIKIKLPENIKRVIEELQKIPDHLEHEERPQEVLMRSGLIARLHNKYASFEVLTDHILINRS